jgi:hypothetical protein
MAPGCLSDLRPDLQISASFGPLMFGTKTTCFCSTCTCQATMDDGDYNSFETGKCDIFRIHIDDAFRFVSHETQELHGSHEIIWLFPNVFGCAAISNLDMRWMNFPDWETDHKHVPCNILQRIIDW